MYFICHDKKVISPNVQMTSAYQKKEIAEQVAKERFSSGRTSHMDWEDKSKPVEVVSVEGFYLVPEALYNEVLKKFVEGDGK